jgi:phosphotransferase system enzyme I (PtsI)
MGLRSFSMHPTQVAAVKQRVLRVDTRRVSALIQQVLASDDPEQACASLFAPHAPAAAPRAQAAA